MRIQGKGIYLEVMERKDCKALWKDYEYDFDRPCERLSIGLSVEKADEWFDDIQKKQGVTQLRLGIYLNGDAIIGDVALQDIDSINRSCTVGMGIAKLMNRGQGHGKQALGLMLRLGFEYYGMERISAFTLETNLSAQRALISCGFVLEGRERGAVYLNGARYDRLCYGILKDEYVKLTGK